MKEIVIEKVTLFTGIEKCVIMVFPKNYQFLCLYKNFCKNSFFIVTRIKES